MLKPIPVEEAERKKPHHFQNGKKQKAKINGNGFHARIISGDENFLKLICVNFANFVNKETKSTIQQIDDMIMGLQKSVLRLQKKKYELLKKEHSKMNKGPDIKWRKRKIS